MKNKTELDPKTLNFEKALNTKPKKSLRPARSMVATRSLKPKTGVATLLLIKTDEMRAH